MRSTPEVLSWAPGVQHPRCGISVGGGTLASVFDRLADEAVAGYDRVVGLDLSECSAEEPAEGFARRPGLGRGADCLGAVACADARSAA